MDFDEALAPLEAKNEARQILFGVKVNSKADVVLIGKHAGRLNAAFQSLVTRLTKKHAAILATEDSAARRAVSNEIMAELYSKAVITGWENVCVKGGAPLPFTVENCAAFLLALATRRPEIGSTGGSIEMYFSNPNNFCDGYGGDIEVLGEG